MFASLSLAATAGIVPPAAMVLPFAVLLLLIAIAPLAFKHHWERRYPQVSVALGLVSVAYYLVVEHNLSPIRHALAEYLSFIASSAPSSSWQAASTSR